ncbi:MAG: hypothetical protein QGF46_01170 [Planctomycetota bacterium]|nr:hypothetical protein [Planctomycetota bacterium]
MVQKVPDHNLPEEGSILPKLIAASKHDRVLLSFIDGRAIAGGLLVNPIQETGLLYDLDEEIRVDWMIDEIASVEVISQ